MTDPMLERLRSNPQEVAIMAREIVAGLLLELARAEAEGQTRADCLLQLDHRYLALSRCEVSERLTALGIAFTETPGGWIVWKKAVAN